MNLIKALGGLSSDTDGNKAPDNETFTAPKQQTYNPPEQIKETPNVMASVLERHERISNRVRTNARR